MSQSDRVRATALVMLMVLAGSGGCERKPAQDPSPAAEAGEAAAGVEAGAGARVEAEAGGEKAGEPATEATAPSGESPPAAGIARTVEDLHRPALGEVQARLAKVLPVERLPAARRPEAPIHWAIPPCPLRYRFQADVGMTVTEGPGAAFSGSDSGQGLRMAGEVIMKPGEEGRAVIHNGELEVSHVTGGTKLPGGKEAAGSLAEIRLRLDGSRWTEVDGPTALWSAYGSFPGLVEFWPALPPGTDPGSTTPWALIIHDRGAGARVESARGSLKIPEGMELPEPSPQTLDAQTELQGWLAVQGQPAAVLEAQWSDDFDQGVGDEAGAAGSGAVSPDIDIDMDTSLETRSRYVVLASGRLLWAEVTRVTHVSMVFDTKGKRDTMKQRHDLRATAQLVEACDGPVLAEPPPEPTPEEAALEAFARLRWAVAQDDSEQVVRLLAPELVAAHGKEAVVRVLREHMARHGLQGFGIVELDPQVRRDGDRVRMHVTASVARPDGDYVNVHTVAVVELRDGRPVIVRMGTDPVERDEGWSILEVSPDRLVSGPVK